MTGPSVLQTGRSDRRPAGGLIAAGVVLLAIVASVALLEWDFRWLTDSESRSEAWERFTNIVFALAQPDLSYEYLSRCLVWARETITTALAGVVFGMLLGWVLAVGASRAVMLDGDQRPKKWPARVRHFSIRIFIEACRFILDALRGVPDFVWAVIFVAFFGLNRIVGSAAIGLSVAGILGKIYSEIWDGVLPKRLEPLRTMGANRVVTLFYGIHPLSARSMVSFTLMRAECAIRNASVLGIVVGGGLGGALIDELANDSYPRVGTLLIVIMCVTLAADLISNAIRYQVRNDPNHPRVSAASPKRQMRRTWIGIGIAVLIGAWSIGDHFIPRLVSNSNMVVSSDWKQPSQSDVSRAIEAIGRMSSDGFLDGLARWWDYLSGRLLVPDLSPHALASASSTAVTPLAVALLATVAAVILAAFLAWLGSVAYQLEPGKFTGERANNKATLFAKKSLRTVAYSIGKLVAMVSRSVPEMLWALILLRLSGPGAFTAILAIGLHSAGVLARVFTETVDNIPYRRLEQSYMGHAGTNFVGVAVPVSWRDWMTYSFFQFESNVRMGVVLGLVGLAGLGQEFSLAYGTFQETRASTLLLTMVLLTTAIDRTSRALNISRAKSS